MASTNPAFNAANFRNVIRTTMTMGLPGATADRATFRWTTQHTYAKHDSAGVPFDLSASPVTTTTHADVQVPVAWEFQALRAASSDNAIGEFDTARAVLTLLDEDYALVAGADLVLLGQNTYDIEFVAPPIGLFEVTVYQLYCRARDES